MSSHIETGWFNFYGAVFEFTVEFFCKEFVLVKQLCVFLLIHLILYDIELKVVATKQKPKQPDEYILQLSTTGSLLIYHTAQ